MPSASIIAIAASGTSGRLTGSARRVWSMLVIRGPSHRCGSRSVGLWPAGPVCSGGEQRCPGERHTVRYVSDQSNLPFSDEIIRCNGLYVKTLIGVRMRARPGPSPAPAEQGGNAQDVTDAAA